MSIFIQVLKDLVGMFIADARLSGAILALVAIIAGMLNYTAINPLTAGWLLLAGCVLLLVTSALRAAASKRK